MKLRRYLVRAEQTWNIFVAAYHTGVAELACRRDRKSGVRCVAQRTGGPWCCCSEFNGAAAINLSSDQKNVPYWAGALFTAPTGPFRAGTMVNFEPIASIDGQGFFLEDMFLITKDASLILTPGGPHSAEEIEMAMR